MPYIAPAKQAGKDSLSDVQAFIQANYKTHTQKPFWVSQLVMRGLRCYYILPTWEQKNGQLFWKASRYTSTYGLFLQEQSWYFGQGTSKTKPSNIPIKKTCLSRWKV